MAKLVFENEKAGTKYDVRSFDKEKGTVTLYSAESGVEFTEKFDKELFKKLGYELKQEA